MVFKSFYPDAVISTSPVGTRILENLKKYGDRIAIVDGDNGKEFTYNDIRTDVVAYSSVLRELGVKKGHVIMLSIPFDPKFTALLVAITVCGGVINLVFTNDEVRTFADELEPFLVVTSQPGLEKPKAATYVLTVTEICNLKSSVNPEKYEIPNVCVNVSEDPIAILSTSGTTGKRKGIVFTHECLNASIDNFVALPIDQSDCFIFALPRYHSSAVIFFFKYLIYGIKMVTSANLTQPKFYSLVKEHEVVWVVLTSAPVLMDVINKGKNPNLESLKFVTFLGMPFPPHLLQKARKELGIIMGSAYGTSETGGIASSFNPKCPPKSCGILMSNIQARIVDPISKKDLGIDERGEIWINGRNVMKMYLNPDDLDKDVKDAEGWFHTGDVGYFDRFGYLYVVDRIKNVIKGLNGISIYPSEMESILLQHPQVTDAGVIKVADPHYLEVAKAFVVCKDECADSGDILKFFNEKVPIHKQIRGGVELIDVIPRAGVGKINRAKLAEIHQHHHNI